MKSESKYDLPLQIPSNKSVSELVTKSPNLLRTHLAYFLSITLKTNDINLLNYLLSADTVNSQKIWNEFLLQCTELGKCNMITLLLQKGHNPNVQNDFGETPLHIAASKGDAETMRILQLYKANCFIKTKDNLTPYDYAIEQGDKKVIELLKRQKNNSMKIEDTARDTEDDEIVSPREINQIKTVKQYNMPCKINISKLLLNNLEKSDKEKELYGKVPQSAKEATMKSKAHYVDNICNNSDNEIKSDKCIIPERQGQTNETDMKEISGDRTAKKGMMTKEKDENYEELFYFSTKNNNKTTNSIVKEEEDDNRNVNKISFINQIQNPDENDDIDYGQKKEEEIKLEDDDDRSEEKTDLLKTIPLELDENYLLNSPFFNNICKDQQHGSNSSNVDTFHSNNLHNSPSKTASNITQTHQPSQEVFQFLDEIKLPEYTQLLIKNGFDDIKVIIDQTKRLIAITEQNLIDAGITISGDRAKILIHLEEKAKLFDFDIKKDNVYYKPVNMGDSTSRSDRHIQSLYRFLSSIKMECFLENFVNAGYPSIDLILVQMLSRQPLTELKLQTEFGIEKIGYRARLITKFREEANNYISKIKNRNIVIDSPKSDSEFCNCVIY